jgi:hypothetical protein
MSLRGEFKTDTLQFHAGVGGQIVTFTADGDVIVDPKFTVSEAAQAFWDCVQKIAAREKAKK